ncbi:hypothetical protein QAD02_007012 [Eretmocerus hayati]|uniref:Uncharacterized protein n=1 Tax=Eretmocerus hayati TaxID=131215 RepID=A0ACC2N2E2_9HYME|nr:hypothetical protein QAD02_007012 [Eretmocerus hayati]
MIQIPVFCRVLQIIIVLHYFHGILDAQPLSGRPLKSAEEGFQYAVLIVGKYDNGTVEHLCAGSLIFRNKILTAASCLQNWNLSNLYAIISVPTGATTRNKRWLTVASIVTYEDFVNHATKEKEFKYPLIGDIAIIELSIWDTGVKPAQLSMTTDLPPTGSFVDIIGFARKAGNRPFPAKQYGSVEVMKKQACYGQAELIAPNYKKSTWSNLVFCAQNSLSILAIDGDFGGAAVDKNGYIVGITFRGRPATKPDRVLKKGQANLLLNVGFYKDFIMENLKG